MTSVQRSAKDTRAPSTGAVHCHNVCILLREACDAAASVAARASARSESRSGTAHSLGAYVHYRFGKRPSPALRPRIIDRECAFSSRNCFRFPGVIQKRFSRSEFSAIVRS